MTVAHDATTVTMSESKPPLSITPAPPVDPEVPDS